MNNNGPKMIQNGPNMIQNGPKRIQKWTKFHPNPYYTNIKLINIPLLMRFCKTSVKTKYL